MGHVALVPLQTACDATHTDSGVPRYSMPGDEGESARKPLMPHGPDYQPQPPQASPWQRYRFGGLGGRLPSDVLRPRRMCVSHTRHPNEARATPC